MGRFEDAASHFIQSQDLFSEYEKRPEKYNLYGGLCHLANGLQDLENRLENLEGQITNIEGIVSGLKQNL